MHMANRSCPIALCAGSLRGMNLLSTRFDRVSLLAMGIFLAYLLIPAFAG